MHFDSSCRVCRKEVIFITGAAGVVGQAFVRKLGDQHFCCLVHKKSFEASNVTAIRGDVREPFLGMAKESYERLIGSLGCIVHSAAVTDFTRAPEEIVAVNVEGTQRVLDLAATARVPIYHISTAFVYPGRKCDPTPYELSKMKAEELVRTSGLAATILRPSVILGDAMTGEIASFQGFHFLVGLFLKGLLPFVPTTPNSYIDFVPQDFVVDVVAALIRQRRVGEEIWLTAGMRALCIDDIVESCLTDIPPRGAPLGRPNMISQDTYERLFKPVFFDALPKAQKKLMDRAMTMVKYLNTLEPLPSSSPELETSLNISRMPDPRLTLRSTLKFLAKHHQIRSGSEKAQSWAAG